MAGPLSSNEIEDVVSSVRRLVSVDARPRAVSRDLGQDRLVLTPALRVVPEPTAPPPLILTVPATDEAPLEALSPEPLAPAAGPEPVSPVVEAEWEDEIWQEQAPPLAELALGVEEAELVPAGATGEAAPSIVEAPSADVPEAPWAQVEDDLPEEDTVSTVIPLTRATPAAPEVVTVAASAASNAADRATPSAAEPEPEQGETTTQTLVDMDGNPLTVLDEEALHEVVRSLIREELQGVLGERITRNVRKLVRAEINRALTARSLD